MNIRLLKAKRVERNIRQKDLAKMLHLTEKSMCQKECSESNKFKADEMISIADALGLDFEEFDAIFFDHRLSNLVKFSRKSFQHNEEKVELRSEGDKLRAVWYPKEKKLEIVRDRVKSVFWLHPITSTYDVKDTEVKD
ncbi:XRE family transcriptional regulator [Butyrivibrio sp. CB08]|uniref:helix-turn-helix domain-containing protein n=1 Tax=Butyrivibrio sp. CB08 TaxID=2364879 RepID=UPI000EA9C349|nr:helix-turn-helix transcriptional regulator [Butyrivibrio sp. CB08]RKM55441.1 XRE family transcriptional regulator [Butyrivibrio sp. CB08]